MFKNAGKKLGSLIKISFFLSATVAFLIPMYILYNANSNDGLLSLICIVCVFIMPVILYIFHLTIYAFAELCANVHDIKQEMSENSTYVNDALVFIAKNLNGKNNANNIENDEKDIDVNINEEEE